MEERRGVYSILVVKSEGKRPLGRSRLRWKDNIKMDLQEVEWGEHGLIGAGLDRDRWRTFVNAIMILRVPQDAGNLLTN
jgi:hypothetical protein